MSAETNNPVRYFGRQVRKERLAAGWTLAEFGQRTGYDPAHLGRIENGKRPATKVLAQMCDRVFPGRGGWFSEFYEESRTWIATPRNPSRDGIRALRPVPPRPPCRAALSLALSPTARQ